MTMLKLAAFSALSSRCYKTKRDLEQGGSSYRTSVEEHSNGEDSLSKFTVSNNGPIPPGKI